MSQRTVTAESIEYLFSSDDEPASSQRCWALSRAQVLDEMTERPVPARATVEPAVASLSTHATPDGIVGLVGIPRQVYPVIAPSYAVAMVVEAPGYLTRTVPVALSTLPKTIAVVATSGSEVLKLNSTANLTARSTLLVGAIGPNFEILDITALGPGPNEVRVRPACSKAHGVGDPVIPIIPDNYAPRDAGQWELHREPTVLHGRVTKSVGAVLVAVPNATVEIAEVWRKIPSGTMAVPPDPSVLVSIQPPLSRDRKSPGTSVERRNLPLTGVNRKQLLGPTMIGSTALRLSNTVGLAVGDILTIDVGDEDHTEYGRVLAVNGGSSPAQPSDIDIELPLTRQHQAGVIVEKINPQPVGPVNQFAQDGFRGDVCLLLKAINGLADGNQVQINDGTFPEFHTVRFFDVKTDAQGYYRFPPLHRGGQLRVKANAGPLAADRLCQPDYSIRENRFDLLLK